MGLNDIGIYLGDGPFSSDIGVVKLYPTRGTHWVCYINENSFLSYWVVCPKQLSKFVKKRIGICLHSEYKIPGLTSQKDSYCCGYCFYLIYSTKVTGIDFKSAVLNLYYQNFS